MAERYTGRHQRQARHGAWVNKKRSRSKPSAQLLPAAAAFTVAGFLFGGAGAAIGLNPASHAPDLLTYDPADIMPPDRNAQAERPSRNVSRNEVTVAVVDDSLVTVPDPDTQQHPARGTAVVRTNAVAAPVEVPVAEVPVAEVPVAEVPATVPATETPATDSSVTTPPATDPTGSTPTEPTTGTPTEPSTSDPTGGGTTAEPTTTEPSAVPTTGSCQATWGSGTDLTATNTDLPVNSLVQVTNSATGQSVVVQVTSSGSSSGCMDLSQAAFATIAGENQTVVDIRYEVLTQDAT